MDNQPSSSTMGLCEDGITSPKELDTYSKLTEDCNERVQMMHALAFNNEQCQYLVDKLKEVIESSSVFLKTSRGALPRSDAPMELEKHLLSFKLLLVVATEIERFIEGCSQDAWVPAAMALTNTSEFVSCMGFHLELCQDALSKRCGAIEGLTFDQVAIISKDVDEIVKTKAFVDKEALLEKISLTLPSLHGDEKDLASYLLQRLLRVAPIPSIPSPESKWEFSRYLAFLVNISGKVKEDASIGRGASATVFKAMWLGMEIAIKVFRGKDNPEFIKEVKILAGLCHPNITSMFCYTQERQKCSIFMELMDGDLRRLMEQRLEVNPNSPPLNIWEAIDLMHQIAEGRKYLHEQEIVHRDLKSLNILVKSVKTPDTSVTFKTSGAVKQKMGKYADALEDFNKANELKPDDAWTLRSRGEVKKLMGKYADALEDFNKANVLEPNVAWMLKHRGEVKTKMGKYANALEDFNKADKLKPNDAWTLKNRGEVQRMMSKYADALEDLNKANVLEPNVAWTLKERGEVKREMGKYADALVDFNTADVLKSNDAWTLKKRGEVKRMMGMFVDALEDLNRADELEPNDA